MTSEKNLQSLVEEALRANDEFFGLLTENAEKAEGSERMRIKDDTDVKKRPPSLYDLLEKSERRSFLRASLYTIDQYALTVVEEYLEQMAYSLSLYRKNAISWLEQKEP